MTAPRSGSDLEFSGEEVVMEGIGVSPGIAIGKALVLASSEREVEPSSIEEDSIPGELARFKAAVERSKRELRKVAMYAREKLGETSADIFEAQIMVLDDEAMHEIVHGLITSERHRADYAVQTALGSIRRRMEGSASEYLRERAGDISDVQGRLMRNLQQARAISKIERDRIVVAETLTAADLLLFSRRRILGIATDFGGPTSHVSIMARSLGIPAVVSLHGFSAALSGGERLVLDGFNGRVVVNPDEATVRRYTDRRDVYRQRVSDREADRDLPAETTDGTHITLRANIELEDELGALERFGAEGVGLFRTEMLLLGDARPLDEDEQYAIYRSVVDRAAPHSCTFRLIDLGGDKMLPMAHREHNPFLGWRGVRVLLDKPDILWPQLRALLRVGAHGPVRILIPMVSSLEEVHLLRDMVSRTAAELRSLGVPHDPAVPLGVMVEVPSVALAADRYAAEVDFMSLGTNDLTQFVLAVDRGNDLVSGRYRESHPVILRLIRDTVRAANRFKIPVSLCGEMAANPMLAPLLVGLGLRELSASPVFIPDLRMAIRATTLDEAESLARLALEQPDSQSVITLASQWTREHLPELAAYFDNDRR
jgi:phosphoenolpyruvate-protein phosphotransferase (PTS system enzyme I)